jgi:hypothetical protein
MDSELLLFFDLDFVDDLFTEAIALVDSRPVVANNNPSVNNQELPELFFSDWPHEETWLALDSVVGPNAANQPQAPDQPYDFHAEDVDDDLVDYGIGYQQQDNPVIAWQAYQHDWDDEGIDDDWPWDSCPVDSGYMPYQDDWDWQDSVDDEVTDDNYPLLDAPVSATPSPNQDDWPDDDFIDGGWPDDNYPLLDSQPQQFQLLEDTDWDEACDDEIWDDNYALVDAAAAAIQPLSEDWPFDDGADDGWWDDGQPQDPVVAQSQATVDDFDFEGFQDDEWWLDDYQQADNPQGNAFDQPYDFHAEDIEDEFFDYGIDCQIANAPFPQQANPYDDWDYGEQDGTDDDWTYGIDHYPNINAAVAGAIQATLAASLHTATDGATYTLPSVNFIAGHLYVIFIGTSVAATPNVTVTSVQGASAVFAQSGTQQDLAAVRRADAWRYVPSSNVTDTLTITLSGTSTSADISLVDITGADTSGVNGQNAIVTVTGNATNSATSALVTMPVFSNPADTPLAFIMHRAAEATTPGAGFTILDDGNHAAPAMGAATLFQAAPDNTVDATWATASNWVGIALEIAVAKVAPPVVLPPAGGGVPRGTIIQNLARHVQRYKERRRIEEDAATKQALEPGLKKALDNLEHGPSELKAHKRNVRITNHARKEATKSAYVDGLRLLAYLEQQASERQVDEEMAIIRIIAELL